MFILATKLFIYSIINIIPKGTLDPPAGGQKGALWYEQQAISNKRQAKKYIDKSFPKDKISINSYKRQETQKEF